MSKQYEQPLEALMHFLAADAVRLQEKFDAHNEKVIDQYKQVVKHVDEPMRQVLPQPNRLIVSEFEASARIEWVSEATTEASIQVAVPNLSADIRYTRQSSNDSRFHIHVQRVPPATPASKPSSSQT